MARSCGMLHAQRRSRCSCEAREGQRGLKAESTRGSLWIRLEGNFGRAGDALDVEAEDLQGDNGVSGLLAPFARLTRAHLDPIVLLAYHSLLPRVELLALVHVLAASSVVRARGEGEGRRGSAAALRVARDYGTTHEQRMEKGAIRRMTCCLSLGIFLLGICRATGSTSSQLAAHALQL